MISGVVYLLRILKMFHGLLNNPVLSVESIMMNLKRNDKFDFLCYKYRCLICCVVSYDISFCAEVYVEPTARSICVYAQRFVLER